MALNKAIKSGKEHRVEYGTKGQPYAKAVDKHCRNHGGRRHQWECIWCRDNRTYRDRKMKLAALYDIKEYKEERLGNKNVR